MMVKQIAAIGLVLLLSFSAGMTGCKKSGNRVADYFENAELQCEGEGQKKNVTGALNDMLVLSEEELKAKRYADYAGTENAWDLPTLIRKHFVPDKTGKDLGNDFYREVKSAEAQTIIKGIEERIR